MHSQRTKRGRPDLVLLAGAPSLQQQPLYSQDIGEQTPQYDPSFLIDHGQLLYPGWQRRRDAFPITLRYNERQFSHQAWSFYICS